MIHTSKFINKNFRIKVSGIDNEGNRINKLVGVWKSHATLTPLAKQDCPPLATI